MDINLNTRPTGSQSVHKCTLCDLPLFSERQVAVVEPCKHQFHIKCAMARAANDSINNVVPICPIDNRPLTGMSFEPVPEDNPQSTQDESATGAGQAQVPDLLSQSERTAIESSPANTMLRCYLRFGQLDNCRNQIQCSAITSDTLSTMMKDFAAEGDRRGYMSCLELVAERGDADAQKKLGSIYLYGQYGASKDNAKARHWLELAANNGNAKAMVPLANMLAFGPDRTSDYYSRVVELMEQGAKLDDPDCLFVLSTLCYSGSPKARTLLERAVALGNGMALRRLTQMMFKGIGGPVKSDDAISLIYEHCQREDSFGQLVQGDQFFAGNRVPKDLRDAEFWYKKSAGQGNSDAKVSLSVLLRNDNPQKADELLCEVLKGSQDHRPRLVKRSISEMFELMRPEGRDGFDDWRNKINTHHEEVDKAVAAVTLASNLSAMGMKEDATGSVLSSPSEAKKGD